MRFVNSILCLCLSSSFCVAQGVFVYDQQSSDEAHPGEAAASLQLDQPLGQSFTPTLFSIGFIRLQMFDINPGNGLGAVIYVNLRTNSVSGPVLAQTDLVSLPNGFGGANVVGFTNFFFSTPAVVTPGVTYYFQPVVQSGDAWAIGRFIPFGYPGGREYLQGQPGNNDLWFREGIVIPEPSSAAVVLVGGGILVCLRWLRKKTPNPCGL